MRSEGALNAPKGEAAPESTGGERTVGGITVEFDGPAGAVMARGFVEDVQSRYAMSVPLAGPSGRASAYHGGGIRLTAPDGTALGPVILARNTSDSPTTVNGRLAVSRENGLVEYIALSTAIGAGATARLDAASAYRRTRFRTTEVARDI